MLLLYATNVVVHTVYML